MTRHCEEPPSPVTARSLYHSSLRGAQRRGSLGDRFVPHDDFCFVDDADCDDDATITRYCEEPP